MADECINGTGTTTTQAWGRRVECSLGRMSRIAHHVLPSSAQSTVIGNHDTSRRKSSSAICHVARGDSEAAATGAAGAGAVSTTLSTATSTLLDGHDDPELCAFICRGPLLLKMGVTSEEVARDIDRWKDLGHRLVEEIGLDLVALTEKDMVRIFHYYVPAFVWCTDQLQKHKNAVGATAVREPEVKGDRLDEQGDAAAAAAMAAPALLIGMSAPQGCGKSTLVENLAALFDYVGIRAAVISVDDFYLTYEDQQRLAAMHPENALLELRGNAGSHDLELGTQTISALKELTQPGAQLKLPRYNKSAFGGRGDRKDESQWPIVHGPIDIILFEGWMLGFEPAPEEHVVSVDPQLALVNRYLKNYYDAWHKYVDSWMIIEVQDPTWVFNWRLEAEVAMRASGKDGMTDEQVADFVSRYIPAYKAYLPGLYSKGPQGSKPDRLLRIAIDEQRNPLG